MFRRSGVSIAAWTIGKIASNHAYHSGTRGGSLRLVKSPAACPPIVSGVVEKLNVIEGEMVRLVEEARQFKSIEGKIDLGPIFKVVKYSEWVKANSSKIHSDIESAYSKSIVEGYSWPANAISEVKKSLESVEEYLSSVSIGLVELLNKFETTIPSLKDLKIYKEAKAKYEDALCIDPITCRLIDGNNGRFLIS